MNILKNIKRFISIFSTPAQYGYQMPDEESKDFKSNLGYREKFFYEYWIGKDIDLEKYWDAYYSGEDYKQKFKEIECYVIEITFKKNYADEPMYNMEPIYKTLKAYYHDLKKSVLSPEEYNSAGPLFVYEINRSSEKWTFLAQGLYGLIYGTTLYHEKVMGQTIENLKNKLDILKEHFPEITNEKLFYEFIEAQTPRKLKEAMEKLYIEKIETIRISKAPFKGKIEDNRKEMVDLNVLFKK